MKRFHWIFFLLTVYFPSCYWCWQCEHPFILPAQVAHPSLFLDVRTADEKSLTQSSCSGSPLIVASPQREELISVCIMNQFEPYGRTVAQKTFLSFPPEFQRPSLSGKSSMFINSHGTVFYSSMCDKESSRDSILQLRRPSMFFFPLYDHPFSVTNATCLPTTLSLRSGTIFDVIVLFGGHRKGCLPSNSSHVLMDLSIFDLSSESMFHKRVVLPTVTEEGAFLVSPKVVATSSGVYLVAGGMLLSSSHDGRISGKPSYAVYALSLTECASEENGVCVEVANLPQLPSSFHTDDSYVTSLLSFTDYLYFADASTNNVAELQLGSDHWSVSGIGGLGNSPINASAELISVQTGQLAFYAAGGSTECPTGDCSLSFSLVGGRLIPEMKLLPYEPSAVFRKETANGTTTILLDVILLGEVHGYLLLANDSACQVGLSKTQSYDGGPRLLMSFTVQEAMILVDQPLFLCFSTGRQISWPAPLSSRSSPLYTPINYLQPFLLPSSMLSHHSSKNKVSQIIIYAVVGVLAFATVLALIVILTSVIRRRKMHTESKNPVNEVDETARLLLKSDRSWENFARMASTNSHSMRYQVIAPMLRIGGERSPTTFLVQRREDNKQLVMKHILCDDDVGRLTSIREFEAIQTFQGHPNVIMLVDMFMSYTFTNRTYSPRTTEKRGRTAGDESANTHATTSSGDGGMSQTASDFNIQGRQEGLPESDASTNSRIVTQRYCCLIFEHYPAGNVAMWCMSAVKRKLTATTITESVILSVALQVLSVLKQLHENSPPVPHRSIKPESILIQSDTDLKDVRIVVGDFGFSSLGPYAPPEIIEESGLVDSEAIIPASDMFCLGLTILSMCTLRFGNDMHPYGRSLKTGFVDWANSPAGNQRSVLDEAVPDPQIFQQFKDSIRRSLRRRLYSKMLISFLHLLLHPDPSKRITAAAAYDAFTRRDDGLLTIILPAAE